MITKTKILIGILVVVILAAGGWWIWNKQKSEITCRMADPLYCESDNDCICVENAGCFLGNKNYYEKCIDKTSICMDFCTGWGQPPVKCINNKCTNNYKTDQLFKQVIETSLTSVQNNYWKESWNPAGIDIFQDAPTELIEKYVPIWKNIFMKKNNITEEYFNQRIAVIDTAISTSQARWVGGLMMPTELLKEKDREYFGVLYKIRVDWIELTTIDHFAIKEEIHEGYLNQSLIEENFNLDDPVQRIATRIHKFIPIEKSDFTFEEAFQKLKQVNLPNSEYLQPRYLYLTDDESGGIGISGFGTINPETNECVQGYLNLLTKEGYTEQVRCVEY